VSIDLIGLANMLTHSQGCTWCIKVSPMKQ
jgi:hypothetical protein